MCIANPIVKGQYQTADNPIFEVFYLEDPHGVIADFSGNPPMNSKTRQIIFGQGEIPDRQQQPANRRTSGRCGEIPQPTVQSGWKKI